MIDSEVASWLSLVVSIRDAPVGVVLYPEQDKNHSKHKILLSFV